MLIPAWVAAMICAQSPSLNFAIAARSPASTALNGSFFFHSGCFGASSSHPVEREHRLRVERMLDPERAVLIEGGDAILGRHEARAASSWSRLHEGEDRLLGRAVVPGRQRIIRRLRRNDEPGNNKENHERTNFDPFREVSS